MRLLDELKRLLEYNPDTGIFIRRITTSPRAVKGNRAGFTEPSGYVRIRLLGKQHYAHRLAWLYMTGTEPKNEIDHLDLNKSNNAWANLRSANRSQNSANVALLPNNRTGLKGVTAGHGTKNFGARIRINGRQIWLGSHATPEDAHAAYVSAATAAFGEYARAA